MLYQNEDLHIDDEAVSAVRRGEVVRPGGRDNQRVGSDDRCAYMLFYCRTTPTNMSGLRTCLHTILKTFFLLYGTVLLSFVFPLQ